MKIIFLLLSICFSLTIKAQKHVAASLQQEDLEAVYTPSKDTLYLPDNDFGRAIKLVWDEDKITKKKPVILFLSAAAIISKQKHLAK